MGRRKQKAEQRLEIPAAPQGFRQGLVAPWRMGLGMLERPFAWLRPGVAAFLCFVALISLGSELVAHGLFPDGNPQALMMGRQLGNQFLTWLFAPSILTVFLGGAVRFIGRGKLEYGLVLEPLRSRTGALLGLGLLAMLLAMAFIGAGKLLPGGTFIAGALMFVAWTPVMTMTTVHIWAEDSSLKDGMTWAGRAVWRQKSTWAGMTACYLLTMTALMTVVIGAAILLTMAEPGHGAMAVLGFGFLVVFAWVATMASGVNAMLALALHHEAINTQTVRGSAVNA